jgi:hypothetical protein
MKIQLLYCKMINHKHDTKLHMVGHRARRNIIFLIGQVHYDNHTIDSSLCIGMFLYNASLELIPLFST